MTRGPAPSAAERIGLACHNRAAITGVIDRFAQHLLRSHAGPLFGGTPADLAAVLSATALPRLPPLPAIETTTWPLIATPLGALRVGVQRRGTGSRLLLWHHALGELPTDRVIGPVWPQLGADWTLVRVLAAGHHRQGPRLRQVWSSAVAATAAMAASVATIEALRRSWDGPVLIAGASLGGLVAWFHACRWGDAAFGCRWAPIAAGPDLRLCLDRSALAWAVSAEGQKHARHLSLPPAPAMGTRARVRPLLGAWDRVQPLRAQAAAWQELSIRPRMASGRGHIGLLLDPAMIATHLRRSAP